MTQNTPCKTCPWIVGNNASVIPNYDQCMAENLMRTVGCGDDFRSVMSCHNSIVGKEIACKGYIAQEGYSNLNVRLMMIDGAVPSPFVIEEACREQGIELEPDYPTVLRKLSK